VTKRERWRACTRLATQRYLESMHVPIDAAEVFGDQPAMGTPAVWVPSAWRTQREYSAALNWLVAHGLARVVTERGPDDPPGKLYEARPRGCGVL
jgi:hypothetical protein